MRNFFRSIAVAGLLIFTTYGAEQKLFFDTHFINGLSLLPVDIQNIIVHNCSDTRVRNNPIDCGSNASSETEIAEGSLLIPGTIRPLSLMRESMAQTDEDLQDLLKTPSEGELARFYFFALQGKCGPKCEAVFLSNEIIASEEDHYYFLGQGALKTYFDGPNRNGMSIYAQVNWYYFKISILDSPRIESNYTDSSTGEWNLYRKGFLNTCMLHTDENKIVCNVSNVSDLSKHSHEIVIVDFKTRGAKSCSIIDGRKSGPFGCSISGLLRYCSDYALKKILYLGKGSYLAVTHEGKPLVFSLQQVDTKSTIAVYKQKYTGATIRDIALDDTYVTPTGFKPRVAFFMEDGDLFVCDLRYFDKPTLLFVEKVENHAAARALYYDKGRLGILFKKENIDDMLKTFFTQPETRDLHDMRVCAANVEALYLKVALRKRMRENMKF